MIRMESKEKDKRASVFDDPFLLAGEIESAADSLLTLTEYIHDILEVSPTKIELLGSYADLYKGDVGRVENVLYAMSALLLRVKDKSNRISLALIEESKGGRTA